MWQPHQATKAVRWIKRLAIYSHRPPTFDGKKFTHFMYSIMHMMAEHNGAVTIFLVRYVGFYWLSQFLDYHGILSPLFFISSFSSYVVLFNNDIRSEL